MFVTDGDSYKHSQKHWWCFGFFVCLCVLRFVSTTGGGVTLGIDDGGFAFMVFICLYRVCHCVLVRHAIPKLYLSTAQFQVMTVWCVSCGKSIRFAFTLCWFPP